MPTPEALEAASDWCRTRPVVGLRDELAELLDRFAAAQRGAEAQPLDVKLRAAQQTGSGDAGERARALVDGWRKDHAMACADIGTERMYREAEAALRSPHREAMEAPFTKALVAEARTQGYREGAEAMREDAVGAVDAEEELEGDPPQAVVNVMLDDPPEFLRATVRATKRGIRNRIRALPIPGKTNAG